MEHPSSHQKPLSPWLVVGLLLAAVLFGYYLIPSKSDLLERQIKDQAPRQALATIQKLTPAERAEKPHYYALLELQLQRQMLNQTNLSTLPTLLRSTFQAYRQHGFRDDFLQELLQQISLTPRPEDLEPIIKPYVDGMPVVGKRSIYEVLSRKALALAKPVQAAQLYATFWQDAPPHEPSTLEMVRLWRMAGQATNALLAVDAFATRSGGTLTKIAPTLARTRIELLRELGQPEKAFLSIRELRQTSTAPELFDLLVQTARESGHGKEVLAELRDRALRSPNDQKLWQELAELAAASGDNDVAIESYQKLAGLRPKDGSVMFKLGQFQEWTGHPSEAFDQFLKALKLGDNSGLGRLLELNPGLYRDSDLVEALAAVQSSGGRNPYEREIARLEARLGEFDQAMRRYDNILAAKGPVPELAEEYGRLLLDLFDYSKAAGIFSEALKRDPGNHALRRGLAEAHFRVGEFTQALEQYEILSNQEPDSAIMENYVTLAESLGRMEIVIAGLARKIQTPDATPREYERLAYFHHLQGRTKMSREVLIAGVKRFPTEEGMRLKAAYALGDEHFYLEAARMLGDHPGLRVNPDLVRYYVSMLVQAQQYQKADAFLKSGLDEKTLELPGLLEVRAQIAEANNHLAEARDLFRQLLRMDPGTLRHTMNYARLLSANGNVKEAELVIRPFLAKPTPEVLKLAAQVYGAMGKPKLAEEYQRRYLQTQPEDQAEAWGFLGDLLLTRGDKVNARRSYQRGLDEMLGTVARRQKKE